MRGRRESREEEEGEEEKGGERKRMERRRVPGEGRDGKQEWSSGRRRGWDGRGVWTVACLNLRASREAAAHAKGLAPAKSGARTLSKLGPCRRLGGRKQCSAPSEDKRANRGKNCRDGELHKRSNCHCPVHTATHTALSSTVHKQKQDWRQIGYCVPKESFCMGIPIRKPIFSSRFL